MVKRFENVVVVVDKTGASQQMIQVLLKLPLFADSKVTLLHAVPPQISADQMRAEWEAGQKMLADALAGLAVQPGMRVTTQLVEGDPKLVVCEVADKTPDPLVVIGSRGLGRLSAILGNSVSQYVFQIASCPMLLVKDDIYVKQTNRIMVALNGTPSAQQAFELALGMIKDVPGGQLFIARIYLDAVEGKDELLQKAEDQAKRAGVSHKVFTSVGDPGLELTRLAQESRADMLLLGSPDRRPTVARSLPDLDRLLGKSTSDYLRVHADCPVLMVRSRE